MRIFDVLGPVMIGPSSSHTAGAARIGLTARKLLGEAPVWADIRLHGSFAQTGIGHGTDRALIAGLLGMKPDDPRLADSFAVAGQEGLSFRFSTVELRNAHPNTVLLQLRGAGGRELEIVASSVGGGRIRVCEIDGVTAIFSGEMNTLIVHNLDQPGHLSEVTSALSMRHINVANMQLYRNGRGGSAVMVLECDQPIPQELASWLRTIPGITKVTRLNLEVE